MDFSPDTPAWAIGAICATTLLLSKAGQAMWDKLLQRGDRADRIMREFRESVTREMEESNQALQRQMATTRLELATENTRLKVQVETLTNLLRDKG